MIDPTNVGTAAPTGTVTTRLLRPGQGPALRTLVGDALPVKGGNPEVNRYRLANMPNVWRGARRILAAEAFKVPTLYGVLRARVIRPDEVVDLGVISLRVVTTAGVNRIVDGLQSSATDLSLWKFHGFGTGTTAEAVGDTALVTELTTQYAVDNTRPTGTQTEGAANVYRSVATLSPDVTATIAEHGIFSQAATGGGVLLDRSQFTGIALTGGSDSLQVTYDFTVTAGS